MVVGPDYAERKGTGNECDCNSAEQEAIVRRHGPGHRWTRSRRNHGAHQSSLIGEVIARNEDMEKFLVRKQNGEKQEVL